MYKLLTFATLLLGLALAPVLSDVDADPQRDGAQTPTPRQLEAQRAAEAPVEEVVVRGCAWACSACEPGQGCSQICEELGDCGSACGLIAQCDSDHAWDENACACK